jgi:hypothetical protein
MGFTENIQSAMDAFNKSNKQWDEGFDLTAITNRHGKLIGVSVWLCQGTYNQDKDEYPTEYHVSYDKLDTLINKLKEIQKLIQENII